MKVSAVNATKPSRPLTNSRGRISGTKKPLEKVIQFITRNNTCFTRPRDFADSALRCSSFSSCVGQFVLTASLRSQVNPANSEEFKEVSPERYAFQLFSAYRSI